MFQASLFYFLYVNNSLFNFLCLNEFHLWPNIVLFGYDCNHRLGWHVSEMTLYFLYSCISDIYTQSITLERSSFFEEEEEDHDKDIVTETKKDEWAGPMGGIE